MLSLAHISRGRVVIMAAFRQRPVAKALETRICRSLSYSSPQPGGCAQFFFVMIAAKWCARGVACSEGLGAT